MLQLIIFVLMLCQLMLHITITAIMIQMYGRHSKNGLTILLSWITTGKNGRETKIVDPDLEIKNSFRKL
ncbi:unnamed protein product [Caenorhabditis angaria]|uniref:Uncharacterized protein n=1 Tax=Caenorhabditis angaria TaxID=860376 RepID=A0A9P1IDB7_9PELO|nr:unnamed protein product [Caenorhabditis angaria]